MSDFGGFSFWTCAAPDVEPGSTFCWIEFVSHRSSQSRSTVCGPYEAPRPHLHNRQATLLTWVAMLCFSMALRLNGRGKTLPEDIKPAVQCGCSGMTLR